MTDEKLEEIAKLVAEGFWLDCGDNSCFFAVAKTGMRTNGGCRCLPNRRVERALRSIPALLAAIAKLRAENERLKTWQENAIEAITAHADGLHRQGSKQPAGHYRADLWHVETTLRALLAETAKGEG